MLGIIHNILGDKHKALDYVEFALGNLQKIDFDGGETEDVLGYIDCFFIRMQHNIILNKSKAVLNDYMKVKDYLSWGDWETEYPDVIKYVEKISA